MRKSSILIVMAILLFSVTATANLLTNGSFEAPGFSGTNFQDYLAPTGWTMSGYWSLEWGMGYNGMDGNNDVWMGRFTGGSSGEHLLNSGQQGVIIEADTTYVYNLDLARFNAQNTVAGSMFMDLQTSGNTVQSADFAALIIPALNDGLNTFTIQWTSAAADAGKTLYVGFAVDSRVIGMGTSLVIDNAVLTVVPEPATMALLAFGAISLIRKKR